jgi:hypothetical protein
MGREHSLKLRALGFVAVGACFGAQLLVACGTPARDLGAGQGGDAGAAGNGVAPDAASGSGSDAPGEAGAGETAEPGGGGSGGASSGGDSTDAGPSEAGSAGEGGAPPSLTCAPALSKPIAVPSGLEVKDNAVLVAVLAADGTQEYTCGASKVDDVTVWAWSTAIPVANLYQQDCTLAGTHSAGPRFTGKDGSNILGTRLRSAPAATPNSLTDILMSSVPNGGPVGLLSPVSAIQRLNTKGGAPPATTCSAASPKRVAVRFTADYYFYSGTDIIPPAQ